MNEGEKERRKFRLHLQALYIKVYKWSKDAATSMAAPTEHNAMPPSLIAPVMVKKWLVGKEGGMANQT